MRVHIIPTIFSLTTAFSSHSSMESRTALDVGFHRLSASSVLQSSTSLGYRNEPDESPVVKPSFISRMRSLAAKRPNNNQVIKTKEEIDHASSAIDRNDFVQTIHTLEEFLELIRVDEKHEDRPIIVIQWHAKWCKACQAILPLYYKLARKYQEHEEQTRVKFVQIAVTDKNLNLHQEFVGLPSLPYAHIYHPSYGLVEELKVSKPRFRKFEQAIQRHTSGFCESPCGDDFENSAE